MTAFTPKQGQYLAFIHWYTRVHRVAPAEADLQAYFATSPSAVHQMILTLKRQGLIAHDSGRARSIRVLVPFDDLPLLGEAEGVPPRSRSSIKASDGPAALVEPLLRRMIAALFAHIDAAPLDDAEFAPLIAGIADAAEEELRAQGIGTAAARRASDRAMDFATTTYVRLCARNDPEDADAQEDHDTFRALMMSKPQRRRRRI